MNIVLLSRKSRDVREKFACLEQGIINATCDFDFVYYLTTLVNVYISLVGSVIMQPIAV